MIHINTLDPQTCQNRQASQTQYVCECSCVLLCVCVHVLLCVCVRLLLCVRVLTILVCVCVRLTDLEPELCSRAPQELFSAHLCSTSCC